MASSVMDPAIAALLARNAGPGVAPISMPSTGTIPFLPMPPMPDVPSQPMTRLGPDPSQIQQSQALQRLPAPDAPTQAMSSPMQPLPMPTSPAVSKIPTLQDQQAQNSQNGTLLAQNELHRLQSGGSGIQQITRPVDANGNPTGAHVSGLRRFGGVLARIGEGVETALTPGFAAATPGTTLHNQELQGIQQGKVNEGLQNQQSEAGTQQQQALTNYTLQRPEIEQSKIDQRQTAVQERVGQAAAARGQNVAWDANGLPTFTDDHTSQAFADHQALSAVHDANAEKSRIDTEISAKHYIPGTQEFADAQKKRDQVDERLRVSLAALGIQREKVDISRGNQALNQDKFYNPQPTAAERGKGDLAQSAVERIAEMRQIIAKHPEAFGPVAGRATNAQQWLGSQDPDAQTYLSASQYLADHSAGVFGGRGQYILSQLHGITDPHSNPAALNAALDEAERAAQGFVKAGTVHGKGGTSGYAGTAANSPQSSGLSVSLKDAMALPQNRGKSAAEVTADIQAHGHGVRP